MIPHVPDNAISDNEWKRRVKTAVNALSSFLTQVDTTAKRPAKPALGQMYYDTTLGKPIWWNGSVWKDAGGTTV